MLAFDPVDILREVVADAAQRFGDHGHNCGARTPRCPPRLACGPEDACLGIPRRTYRAISLVFLVVGRSADPSHGSRPGGTT
jgi:hypothetical protein